MNFSTLYNLHWINRKIKNILYFLDFKQGALDYIKEGHSRVEAAKVFDVGVRTLFTWEKKLREQEHLERKNESSKSGRFL